MAAKPGTHNHDAMENQLTSALDDATATMLADLNGGALHDAVNHPQHYTSHPSGVECIQVTEHMSFNLGNATKYIWRADSGAKDRAIEDLHKARWYIGREILRRST